MCRETMCRLTIHIEGQRDDAGCTLTLQLLLKICIRTTCNIYHLGVGLYHHIRVKPIALMLGGAE